ncbi:MAG: hypothetical protein BWK79_03225 [Beggiatoa sp. IS2]|nr:MAG: hypothetical protein BWK79_03225 [Beggiatoa sp. IS2]
MTFLSLFVYGSFFIGSNFYVKTICSTKNAKKAIAITFDDGPIADVTPAVLAVLQEFQVKATFFCVGARILGNEILLKRIIDEGHLIGNHTFSHSHWFGFFSIKKLINELKQTEELILATTGQEVIFFRPPYGVTNPIVKNAVDNLNYLVIGWSVRSLDTLLKSEQKILDQITQNLKGGDIILFHDTHPRIITVLRNFLKYASDHGFTVVRLDELLQMNDNANF